MKLSANCVVVLGQFEAPWHLIEMFVQVSIGTFFLGRTDEQDNDLVKKADTWPIQTFRLFLKLSEYKSMNTDEYMQNAQRLHFST